MRTICLALSLSCAMLAATMSGQSSASNARIRASVLSYSGEHVPGAEVLLRPSGDLPENSLHADASIGAAFFVAPGQYILTSRFNELTKVSIPVSLAAFETRSVRFVMVADKWRPCEPSSVKEMPAYFAESKDQTHEATIFVTAFDATGAVTAFARVELSRAAPDSDNAAATQLTLDGYGSASLKLRPGRYLLKVIGKGFRVLEFKFSVGGGETVGIAAQLAVSATCDGVVVPAAVELGPLKDHQSHTLTQSS